MPWRFNSQTVFLTYPQAHTLSKEVIQQFLQEQLATEYIIAKEFHEDGSPHYHAYARFPSKKNTTNERYFDLNGCHPNIQSPRQRKSVIAYIAKSDPEPICFGITPQRRGYGEIRDSSTDVQEYMRALSTSYPRDVALNHDRLLSYAVTLFRKEEPPYEDPGRTFSLPESLEDWKVNLTQVITFVASLHACGAQRKALGYISIGALRLIRPTLTN